MCKKYLLSNIVSNSVHFSCFVVAALTQNQFISLFSKYSVNGCLGYVSIKFRGINLLAREKRGGASGFTLLT